MINKNILFGLLILPYGGGNCLFGTEITEDKTTPLFRGNVSMVEVASTDTNPTKLPDIEPLQVGKIDTATTRCFDLFCVGKYEQGSNLKLNIQPADEIPNLVTKNANGDPVFAEPKPMCTIRAPKGHNVWVKIALQEPVTNVSAYVALGIKKQSEDEYFDILHTENLSRYVDVLESDVVELVPLASSTKLPTYTAVKAGDTAKITGENAYDFGSVYRVNVSIHDGQWLTNQPCDLSSIYNNECWYNFGRTGVGPVTDQSGKVHENQLFAINFNGGQLAYSSDGAHWIKNGSVAGSNCCAGPVYGNGIWCAVANSSTYGIRRSTDGGKTWSGTLANISSDCLNFANGIFMTVANPGVVYTSPDAEIWTQVGSVKLTSGAPYILIYGAGKWICGSIAGYVCQSKDNGKTWEQISDGLYQINVEDNLANRYWNGGFYVNGYFYAIGDYGLIARSSDGVEWKKVLNITDSAYYRNITYYKNKLWAFSRNGQKYTVGLFNPDGTIESLEN